MVTNPSGIKGILFDLDGVLHIGDEVIDGAQDTLHFLKRHAIASRFITNTSTKTAFVYFRIHRQRRSPKRNSGVPLGVGRHYGVITL